MPQPRLPPHHPDEKAARYPCLTPAGDRKTECLHNGKLERALNEGNQLAHVPVISAVKCRPDDFSRWTARVKRNCRGARGKLVSCHRSTAPTPVVRFLAFGGKKGPFPIPFARCAADARELTSLPTV